MKKMKEQMKINKLIAASLLGMSLFASPAFSDSCNGGSCGGGGNTIHGESVDNYLAKHKMKSEELLSIVKDEMELLRVKAPTLARDIERFAKEINWYVVDEPLENLPFTITKIPFKTDQTYRQVDNDVYVYGKGEKELIGDERKTMFFHEFFQNRFLQNSGVNNNLTQGGVRRAANLVMESVNKSGKELQQALAEEGFDSQTIAFKKQKGEDRKLAMEEKTIIPIPLDKPISIAYAREAIDVCVNGAATDISVIDPRDSALGQLLKQIMPFPLKREFLTVFKGGSRGALTLNRLLEPSFARLTASEKGLYEEINYGKPQPGITDQESTLYFDSNDRNNRMTLSYHENTLTMSNKGSSVQSKYNGATITNTTFPTIQYQLLEGDALYNRLGLINTESRLHHLAISIPTEVIQNNWNMSVKNYETDVQLPYTIDAKQYVDCVQREMKLREGHSSAKEKKEEDSSPAVISSKSAKAKQEQKSGSNEVSRDEGIDAK